MRNEAIIELVGVGPLESLLVLCGIHHFIFHLELEQSSRRLASQFKKKDRSWLCRLLEHEDILENSPVANRFMKLSFVDHATLLVPNLEQVLFEFGFEGVIIVDIFHLLAKLDYDGTEVVFNVIVA